MDVQKDLKYVPANGIQKLDPKDFIDEVRIMQECFNSGQPENDDKLLNGEPDGGPGQINSSHVKSNPGNSDEVF